MSDEIWTVRLGTLAETDFADIVAWTTEHYGPAQARIYSDTVTAALIALRSGPQINGVKPRDDIGKGLYALHVARNKRRGRHLIGCHAPNRAQQWAKPNSATPEGSRGTGAGAYVKLG